MKPKLKNLKAFGSSSKKSSSSANSNNSSYLAEDENFKSFSTQLERLGLQLRDITGDGNCCFRALSDQMFGNEGQHFDFRKRVCQYIRQNRDEFEPFVAALIDDEDDDNDASNNNAGAKVKKFLSNNKKLDAFEKYIKNLEQAGTYADNGCLVAFARLYQVNINIHQLNMPIWTISCQDTTAINQKKTASINQALRELHLSYHNGEHYSSIRPLGDNTQTPTNINFYQDAVTGQATTSKSSSSATKSGLKNGSASSVSSRAKNSDSTYNLETKSSSYKATISGDACNHYDVTEYEPLSEELEIQIEQIIDITKCMDINLVKEYLVKNNYDTGQTIHVLMSSMNLMSLGREMNNDNEDAEDEGSNDGDDERLSSTSNRKGATTAAATVKDKKNEKKERQMERQRLKVLEQREKELLVKQKTSKNSSNAVKAGSSAVDNQCPCENSGSCAHCAPAQSRNGVAPSLNSNNNGLDFNVSLSKIETKTI
jgi:OTU domain-containing protein 3